MRLIILFLLINWTLTPCSAQEWNKFICDGSGKCSGLQFSIKYPYNWISEEGNHPHTLKTISYEEERGLIQMTFYVRELEYIPTKREIDDTYTKETFLNNFNGVQILEFNNNTKIDMENCITATMFAKQQVYDKEVKSLVRFNMIFYDRYILQVNFFIYGYDGNDETMKKMLAKYNSIFNEIMYSLTLISKWEKHN